MKPKIKIKIINNKKNFKTKIEIIFCLLKGDLCSVSICDSFLSFFVCVCVYLQ